MTPPLRVHLGFEVDTGESVAIPMRHLAVTGQTQESGKTTTLEALVVRSGATALTFVTKRGEASFTTGRRIAPYFRDRADWQFVTSIIDATLQEKNKFLRPWIMKICRTTRTLAEVHTAVRTALSDKKKLRGWDEGVFVQLDAYLDLIVPEIRRARLAATLDLAPGLNVMDLAGFATPMQMLFVQSALDFINAECRDTIVVIPEAWEFIPEGKGSPVKASAIALVRKGGAIGNHIWVDSQDMAGVDKTILRGCAVWLIGVQREANELKRNLANIPAGINRPTAAMVATLARGQFYACHGHTVTKTYVQPAWMDETTAKTIALGLASIPAPPRKADTMTDTQALVIAELKRTIADLEAEVRKLLAECERLKAKPPPMMPSPPMTPQYAPPTRPSSGHAEVPSDVRTLYAGLKRMALDDDDPKVLALLRRIPEIEVTVERQTIEANDTTLFGRLAALIAEGWFADVRNGNAARMELARRGRNHDPRGTYRELDRLAELGFLTKEKAGYLAVPGMAVRIIERERAA